MDKATKEHFREKLLAMKKELIEALNNKYNENIMLGRVETDALKLRLVDQALQRIENDTYGVCIECEEEINPRRLEYVPFARYCTECKSELEKKGLIKM